MGMSYHLHTFMGVDITDIIQEWLDDQDDAWADDWEDQAPEIPAGLQYLVTETYDGELHGWVVYQDSYVTVDLEGFDEMTHEKILYETWPLDLAVTDAFGVVRQAKFYTHLEVT